MGAAGVIWAMIHLAGRAVSIGLPDFSQVTRALVEPNRAWIRGEKVTDDSLATCGLLTGDTGILLVHARLSGQASVILDQVGGLAARETVLMVLEGSQWLDPTSTELFERL